jgi:hypothetical protein
MGYPKSPTSLLKDGTHFASHTPGYGGRWDLNLVTLDGTKIGCTPGCPADHAERGKLLRAITRTTGGGRRFTISHNLPVTRRCFHTQVIHSHPMDVHPQPRPVAGDRGYLAPLRRGLLLCPETARIGRQRWPRAGGGWTLFRPQGINLSPANPARGSSLRDYRQKSLNRFGASSV